MKRILVLGLVGVSIVLAPSLKAFRPPERPPLPNFDKRERSAVAHPKLRPERAEAANKLKERVPGLKVSVDPVIGSPKFVASGEGLLSGPDGQGRGISEQFRKALPNQDRHRSVKAFLNEHSALFGHGSEALERAPIAREYTTKHNGLHTTVWQQEVDGIAVFQGLLIGHVTKDGELVNIASQFVSEPERAANAGTPNRAAKIKSPPISARRAIVEAARNVGEALEETMLSTADEQPGGPRLKQKFKASAFLKGQTDAQLVWLPISGDELRLCWEIVLSSKGRGEMFRVVVDAQTGEVLVRHCLTNYISDATYRVYTSDSPSPMSPGLPVPGNGQPPLVPRSLVVTSALNTNASPNGWIDDGVNETRGNNVDAHLDRDDNDQPDAPRVQGNPNRVFDFPMDLTQQPDTYGDAAVVQLFYWNNIIHDRLYELGFTEAAGNFQNINFHRGGLDGDAVQADAQDGSGTDNANFSTPPDGSPGRMQMYVFAGPNPDRDGDFDTEIVIHEYVHGLSGRMVGGGALISALQTAGMGEGWSDFYALSLLSEPGDDPNAPYAMGGYATLQFFGVGSQNYYYGIRDYPYCTDTNKNPLTFKDIDPEQTIPHTGVPVSPNSPFDPNGADAVHHQGQVWCVTLWEARALLIAKYGHAVGNQLMLQLVTEGMRLSPVNPNFLQARDAIIQADLVNNGGANFDELWKAFAKRGMGGSATSPESNTTRGLVEAFDLPGLTLQQAVVLDAFTGNGNGTIDINECVELNLLLINKARVAASGISATLTTTTTGVLISQAESTYPDIPSGAIATNRLPFRLYTSPGFVCGRIIDLLLTVSSGQDSRTIKLRLNTGLIGQPVAFATTSPVNIPDANISGAESPVTVSGFNSAISKVTVSVHVTHTRDVDLTFYLYGPDGSRVLLSRNNGWLGANYGAACSPESSRTTFDDKATIPIEFGIAPFVGVFKPEQALSAFNGKTGNAVNGVWRLRAVDEFFRETGTIQCWTLNLSPTVCTDGGGDCSTDLALAGSFKPQIGLVNSNLTYTYTVTNRGPNTARNVSFVDTLPTGVVPVSASTTRGSCTQGGGTVNCGLGTMPVGSSATITVVALPLAAGTITNTALVTSSVADQLQTNNTSILVTQILPPSPIIVPAGTRLLAESSLPLNGGIDPGETVTIDFALQNIGSLPTANLVATLLNANGVSNPSGAKNYGALLPGSAHTNEFTFTANGTPGSTLNVTFQLQESGTNLSTVVFPFVLANVVTFTNPAVVMIPDSGTPALYPSSIPVSGVTGLVNKVSVTLVGVSHTSPDDLDILLVGPNGRSALLMSDAGGGYSLNNRTIVLDPSAQEALLDEEPLTAGVYQPANFEGGDGDTFPAPAPVGPYNSNLGIFNSSNPNGTWSLYVLDDAAGDAGRFAGGWRLSISTFDPVNATSDLAVFGSASPNPATYGGNLTYNITVTNQGPHPANSVVLSNQIPAGTTFGSVVTSQGSCSNINGIVVCNFGTLTNRARATVAINLTANRTGSLTNIARVSGNVVDYNVANNVAQVISTVGAVADLAVSSSVTPSPGIINSPLTFTLTVTNQGPDNATSVVLTNVLPAGVTYLTAISSQGTATHNNGTVVCNLGNLARNARATVTISVLPQLVASINNKATVAAAQPADNVSANNTSDLVVQVNNPALIIVPAGSQLVTESYAPATGGMEAGETVTLNLALRNQGIANTANLVATLRNSGGVNGASAAQQYGVLAGGGASASRPFTFTVGGNQGAPITATLDLANVANGQTNSLGTAVFNFVIGSSTRVLSTISNGIPDNAAALVYPSQITVSNLSGTVSKVSVTLSNLNHSYPDDLDVLLVSPSGARVLLVSDAGGSALLSQATLTLDDNAAVPLPNDGPIVSGVYQPTDYNGGGNDSFPAPAPAGPYTKTLGSLAGTNPNGVWSLFIVDDAIGDAGNLGGGWSLNITTVGRIPGLTRLEAARILNGQFQFTVIGAAGDNLVIEGSNDLQTWSSVGNVSIGATGSANFQQAAAAAGFRFYRAVQP